MTLQNDIIKTQLYALKPLGRGLNYHLAIVHKYRNGKYLVIQGCSRTTKEFTLSKKMGDYLKNYIEEFFDIDLEKITCHHCAFRRLNFQESYKIK